MLLRRRLPPALLLLFACRATAQDASVRSATETVPDEIGGIVRQIDAHHIERTIRTLVSFGTRNTLSTQNDPTRGIGAARDWLYGEFMKLRTASGGD